MAKFEYPKTRYGPDNVGIRGRPMWELRAMKKALSSFALMNTPAENTRLRRVKAEIKRISKSKLSASDLSKWVKKNYIISVNAYRRNGYVEMIHRRTGKKRFFRIGK